MDDALLVCFVNGGTHLFENVGHPFERETFLFRQHITERAAVEILHHEVSNLTRLNVRKTEVGYVNNVWMA